MSHLLSKNPDDSCLKNVDFIQQQKNVILYMIKHFNIYIFFKFNFFNHKIVIIKDEKKLLNQQVDFLLKL